MLTTHPPCLVYVIIEYPLKNQEASSILRMGFALSKWPHLHREWPKKRVFLQGTVPPTLGRTLFKPTSNYGLAIGWITGSAMSPSLPEILTTYLKIQILKFGWFFHTCKRLNEMLILSFIPVENPFSAIVKNLYYVGTIFNLFVTKWQPYRKIVPFYLT